MNFLILEEYPNIKEKYLSYLQNDGHKLFKKTDNFNNDNIDGIIIRSKIIVDKNLLEKYQNLKYVFRVGVGLDKVDLELCAVKGIKVINTPGVNSSSVAELVIAGALNLNRKLFKKFNGLENRFDFLGTELSGKTVGIIGFGNIGKEVYKRFLAFGIKEFLIYDPFLEKKDIEIFEKTKKVDDKNEIFKNSNILSFHIPLLDSTRNFLGKDEIANLKSDVKIINTSRGGIIDELELINFLKENRNSGFFADVWEEEPEKPKKGLLDLENVILTAHIGAMTKEAEEKMHFFKF